MTNESIKKIEQIIKTYLPNDFDIDTAIKALEQQPSEDCISRESVRELICQNNDYYGYSERFHEFTEKCLQLPSVTPQRPKGKWIEANVSHKEDKVHIDEWQSAKCSNCGLYHTTPYMYYFDIYKYCPNCGAEMSGGGEE